MSFLLLLISAAIIIYLLCFRNSNQFSLQSKIPGPPKLPLFGNSLDLNVSSQALYQLLLQWSVKHGPRVHFQVGHLNYVTISQAKDAEKILSSHAHTDKSSGYNFLIPWLGTGLVLDNFIGVFNEQTSTLVQVLNQEFEKGQVFDIFPNITRCALDIICESAMGRKIHAQKERETDYVKAIHRITELVHHRQLRPWLHPDFLWKLSSSGKEEAGVLAILHGFTENVIAEKKAELSVKRKMGDAAATKGNNTDDGVFMSERRRVAFLDLLLTAQAERKDAGDVSISVPPLTDRDIRDETDTFMFGGHDTTAATASWTTFLLGCYPEIQKKVHDELDGIFGDDKERHVTTADISKMKYLESCVKESLRLYPSVPMIGRAIKTGIKLDDEVTLPSGTTAFIMPFIMHRDSTVFPDPDLFLPDRFFPENSVGRNPYAYIPFSAGPRNCIGQKFAIMEEKVMLVNIFRNFTVEAAEKREDLILLAELIMRPKHGLHVKLTPRN